jgi:hypothetical protein
VCWWGSARVLQASSLIRVVRWKYAQNPTQRQAQSWAGASQRCAASSPTAVRGTTPLQPYGVAAPGHREIMQKNLWAPSAVHRAPTQGAQGRVPTGVRVPPAHAPARAAEHTDCCSNPLALRFIIPPVASPPWPLSFSVTHPLPQVLAYLGNRVVRPVWTDPVCGDGRCEAPWEFPAWGPFGCRADCGPQPNTTAVLVTVSADFLGHPSLSPRMLMAGVRWNLCLDDAARRTRGEIDICWCARACRGRLARLLPAGGAEVACRLWLVLTMV